MYKRQHYSDYTGTFETNPKSEAYVKEPTPKNYYQGCLWGGQIKNVIPMMKTLKERVDKDYENDIIAVWHDESHLNKYLIENSSMVHTYGPEYAYPELFKDQCTFNPKIVHLAKDNSEYQVS